MPFSTSKVIYQYLLSLGNRTAVHAQLLEAFCIFHLFMCNKHWHWLLFHLGLNWIHISYRGCWFTNPITLMHNSIFIFALCYLITLKLIMHCCSSSTFMISHYWVNLKSHNLLGKNLCPHSSCRTNPLYLLLTWRTQSSGKPWGGRICHPAWTTPCS